MKFNYSLIILVFFIVFSCKKDSSFIISSETISESYNENCEGDDCATVTIDYVKVTGDEAVSEKINSKIEAYIIHSLSFNNEDKLVAKTIDDAVILFLQNYEADKKAFPDLIGGYFAEISVDERFASSKFLCFEMNQFMFTGGAHGYSSNYFLNVDSQTGETILIEDLIKPGFIKYAETKFKEEMEIPLNEPINSTGFWFENDTFYLPETIGITKNEVILHYNQYEIASYAAGPITISIPLKDCEDLLNL